MDVLSVVAQRKIKSLSPASRDRVGILSRSCPCFRHLEERGSAGCRLKRSSAMRTTERPYTSITPSYALPPHALLHFFTACNDTYIASCIYTSTAMTTTVTASPLARFYYLEISANLRHLHRRRDGTTAASCTRSISTSHRRASSSGSYQRSDFTNQPFTGVYDAGGVTEVSQYVSKAKTSKPRLNLMT